MAFKILQEYIVIICNFFLKTYFESLDILLLFLQQVEYFFSISLHSICAELYLSIFFDRGSFSIIF